MTLDDIKLGDEFTIKRSGKIIRVRVWGKSIYGEVFLVVLDPADGQAFFPGHDTRFKLGVDKFTDAIEESK